MSLSDAERAALTTLIHKHGAPQSLAVLACTVLAAASGLTNKEIVDVCAHTAGVWRKGIARDGMDGLYDEQRPGASRQIVDDEIVRHGPEGPEDRTTMVKAAGHARSLHDHLGVMDSFNQAERFFALLTALSNAACSDPWPTSRTPPILTPPMPILTRFDGPRPPATCSLSAHP